MTRRTGQQAVRRLLCSGCGTEFTCDPSGNCWCAEEAGRLPMPTDGGDCLCRDCLRTAVSRSSSPKSLSPKT
ncbi:hypothetical protein [Nitrobacter sp.]|uniref:hypothetical protein n=1 Tax=unclassified Nitrobacter TaxID=2620411 RepID=UPI002CABF9B3|nr:hypothetical protein [Nitrobacter sp.]